jgi:uncharacterized protein YqeY
MTLSERLTEDMKKAMKAQDVSLLSTLRMLKSALQNQTIALGHELSDTEVLATLEKQAKQRRDSIEQFQAGNREDLAAVERAELSVIETYLPQKLDAEAVALLVAAAITETGATTISDMGKVMKLVMEKAAGAANGRLVSEITKAKLA